MRESLIFLIGMVFGGIVVVIILKKRENEGILSEVETHTGDELARRLDNYMITQKEFRKHTRYSHEFGIESFGEAPQPDHKTLVKWLNKQTGKQQQLPGIEEYVPKLLKRHLNLIRKLNDISDYYHLLRLLDALADMELLEELESSGKISLDTAKECRETPEAEIKQLLEELGFNECH